MRRTKLKRVLVLALAAALIGGFAADVSGLGTATAYAESAPAAEAAAIGSDTVWSYLDTGADPAGDSAAAGYDRTSWTVSGYDTSAWKTGSGSFGSKKGTSTNLGNGYTAANQLTQYKTDTTTDIEAYFFRTTVNITNPSEIKTIAGSVVYDDAATVYINGTKVAGFDDSAITANIQYGGSNDGDPRTGTISITENIQNLLVEGENVIAVEIHQGRESSSDIYFSMPSLTFSTEESGATEPEETEVSLGSVSLSVGSDQTKRNFTWYSNESSGGYLLIAKASELQNGQMPDTATHIVPSVKAAANKSGYYSCQATAEGLESNTTYAYQMVDGETATEVNTFVTGSGSSFSFVFAGDPQIGASGNSVSDADGWEKTLNLIASRQELSGAEFMLSAGDQVNRADDEDQYDSYLNHSTLLDLPVATVVGNHDTSSSAYDEHFNVPNESAYGSTNAGGDYYFVYNNVLFMALNSNNRSTAEHEAFMKEAIAATENQNITWKIVTFHHSIYSVANHASEPDILERRTQLSQVFKDLDIDVVLMGHDHVYCRTYMMDGETPMTDASIYDNDEYTSITNPDGILYVTANSASGSKFYTIQNAEFPYSRVMNQERIPNISRIDISDGQFKITTYRTSDMSVVDTFTINHKQAYDVTVNQAANGTASADVTSAYAGDTVTLTAAANEGYEFKGWTVVGKDVTIENNTFVMPEGAVEVTPVFEKIASDNNDDGNGASGNNTTDTTTTGTTTNTTATANSTSQTSQVGTGDHINVMVPAAAMLISAAAVLVLVFRRKRL